MTDKLLPLSRGELRELEYDHKICLPVVLFHKEKGETIRLLIAQSRTALDLAEENRELKEALEWLANNPFYVIQYDADTAFCYKRGAYKQIKFEGKTPLLSIQSAMKKEKQ